MYFLKHGLIVISSDRVGISTWPCFLSHSVGVLYGPYGVNSTVCVFQVSVITTNHHSISASRVRLPRSRSVDGFLKFIACARVVPHPYRVCPTQFRARLILVPPVKTNRMIWSGNHVLVKINRNGISIVDVPRDTDLYPVLTQCGQNRWPSFVYVDTIWHDVNLDSAPLPGTNLFNNF